MCWDLVVIAKDRLDGVAAAIYRKPIDNECYKRRLKNEPPMCSESDDPNAAWYIYFCFFGSTLFIWRLFAVALIFYFPTSISSGTYHYRLVCTKCH